MLKESSLREALRDTQRFPEGVVSFIEPGKGSDFGLPDCLLAVGGHWEPVELKRGNSVVKALRPTQRVWHRNSLHLGIQTFGLTLRKDESVILFKLDLSGGLMGILYEVAIEEFKLSELSHKDISNAINVISCVN